ncbi:TonB-dependent hemoglobin/transferrin/lactoferrin receptor family protein [Campylobacter pinnipediorum subsp. pinnipediorum]|uniref:TonB-dependent receptor domain-containing protein n=1 Tax=Campylobacter pinnipediorum TaxID=1965231 RepID=UPI0009C288A8|nr:TonB-dependent receptor [Campylobacter pinnipediorum]AQW81434.1 TonB-dependent hemoglobin/transferrin/lactoferrin receptor family protein [Campylobacter pinnipediorum subsp. pinnipediorum]
MNKLRFSMVALLVLGFGVNLHAADISSNQVELDSVTVTGESENDPTQKKVGERVKSAKTLTKEQAQDTRDLVKYETGVSVVENGRFGASGYSIRGVDENRVAITIDGLHQAETLSSQGFKELFEGYGNFNNSRNGVEVETLKQVRITKGADSIKAGSGALGGSVMFETKDARDYLLDKDYFYGFKTGYSTANSQKYTSHTLAAKYKWFDILFIRTDRKGHELKNYGYDEYDDSVVAAEREKADPYTIKKESNLLKFGFSPSDTTRVTAGLDYYKDNPKGHDYSYNLSLSQFSDTVEEEKRYTNDLSTRKNYFVTFENFNETPFWDSAKLTLSHQKTKTRAKTEERCFGDNCRDINNPAGFHLDENNNYLDKDNKLLKLVKEKDTASPLGPEYIYLKSDDRTKYKEGDKFRTSGKDAVATTFTFDCSFFNCEKPVNLIFEDKPINIDLSSKNETIFNRSYKGWDKKIKKDIYHVTVETINKNNKIYKKINSIREYTSLDGTDKKDQDNSFYIPLPYSAGFSKNDWKQRDLDNETKQVNLDFEKSIDTKNIDHFLSYGGLYSINKKSMTNIEGSNGSNVKWWANSYKEDCKSGGNTLQCPIFSGEESFLVPTTKTQKAFYVSDDIKINDFISLKGGFRKDFIKYRVDYEEGKSPKIPDGFLGALAKHDIEKPRYTDPKYIGTDPNKSGENHPQYLADRKKFIESARIDKKYKGNIFNETSHFISLDLDPIDFLRLQGKYSKGFRAPTPDELYFNFRFPGFIIVPNTKLKPEISKTKEVAITLYNNLSFITVSGFETKYKDFLDFRYVGAAKTNKHVDNGIALSTDLVGYQNVNRAVAKVTGIEIDSKINLKDIKADLPGFYFGVKYTRQKGKVLVTEDGKDVFRPMNAIQPNKFIYNIGYSAPNDKFGADIFITRANAKKPGNTYNMFWLSEKREDIIVNNKKVQDSSAHWLSNKYTTIDLISYVRPRKNITFRLGAYNLTDKKYINWESARSIRSFGTTNRVRKSDNLGLNRFNAPGRNFKLDFEITF